MSDFLFLLTFFMTVITKCDSSSFCCYNMLTRTSSMISATHAFGEATWFTSNKYVLAGFAVNVLTECSRGLFPGGHFLWRVLALSSSDRFFIVRREDRRVRAFEDFLRTPRGSVLSSPKSALIFMEWPCQKEWISNRRTASLVLTLVGKSAFTLDIWKIDFQNKLSKENKTWLWTFGTESKISCSVAIKKHSITTRCKFHAVFLNSFVSKSFSEHYKQWTF